MPGTVVNVENPVVNQTHIFREVSVAAVEGARREGWKVKAAWQASGGTRRGRVAVRSFDGILTQREL